MRSLPFLLPALLLSLAGLTLSAQTAAPVTKVADTKAAPAMVKNFKLSGAPTAKVQIEIYTDYECPACRDLYLNTIPSLNKEYVQTGKVRLLHRDFPLQQHKYTRLATRYANAAGQMGKYDLVVNQLFLSQPEWSQNGNIDAALAKVVPAADLAKIRELATGPDTKIDEGVLADVAMGNTDGLRQTPTIVILAKGKRDVISGAVPFSILKSYLDKKLAE
jgi:protein-disulfide isomerase